MRPNSDFLAKTINVALLRVNKAFDYRYLIPTLKHGGGCLMDYISDKGTRNLVSTDGKMNLAHYQKILGEKLSLSALKLRMRSTPTWQ